MIEPYGFRTKSHTADAKKAASSAPAVFKMFKKITNQTRHFMRPSGFYTEVTNITLSLIQLCRTGGNDNFEFETQPLISHILLLYVLAACSATQKSKEQMFEKKLKIIQLPTAVKLQKVGWV
jgi:hypothetical protein